MAKTKVRRLRPLAALSKWRLVLGYAVLAAFTLQSYVVQTHVHFAPPARLTASLVHNPAPDRSPGDDDPANCPLCQEILHGGPFVTPVVEACLPAVLAGSTVAIVDSALPFVFTLSHDWRGRAPPLR